MLLSRLFDTSDLKSQLWGILLRKKRDEMSKLRKVKWWDEKLSCGRTFVLFLLSFTGRNLIPYKFQKYQTFSFLLNKLDFYILTCSLIRCFCLKEEKKSDRLLLLLPPLLTLHSSSTRHPPTESSLHSAHHPSIHPSFTTVCLFCLSLPLLLPLSRNAVTTPLPPQHPPPPSTTPLTRSYTTHNPPPAPPQRALSLTLDTHHQDNFLGLLPWRLSGVQSVMMPLPSARSRLSLQETVQSSK